MVLLEPGKIHSTELKVAAFKSSAVKDQELFKQESKLVLKIFAKGLAWSVMLLLNESLQPADEVAISSTL